MMKFNFVTQTNLTQIKQNIFMWNLLQFKAHAHAQTCTQNSKCENIRMVWMNMPHSSIQVVWAIEFGLGMDCTPMITNAWISMYVCVDLFMCIKLDTLNRQKNEQKEKEEQEVEVSWKVNARLFNMPHDLS